MRHKSTVPIFVWLSGPEFYLPQFLIVKSPGKLSILLLVCSWIISIFFLFFCTIISCWSSVTVNPSSHRTPNNMSRAGLIFGKM